MGKRNQKFAICINIYIKMNHQGSSGVVWLLLFALAMIGTGNAVTESKPAEIKRGRAPSKTMVVENLNQAMDICATANVGQRVVVRCQYRCTCGPSMGRLQCLTYCP